MLFRLTLYITHIHTHGEVYRCADWCCCRLPQTCEYPSASCMSQCMSRARSGEWLQCGVPVMANRSSSELLSLLAEAERRANSEELAVMGVMGAQSVETSAKSLPPVPILKSEAGKSGHLSLDREGVLSSRLLGVSASDSSLLLAAAFEPPPTPDDVHSLSSAPPASSPAISAHGGTTGMCSTKCGGRQGSAVRAVFAGGSAVFAARDSASACLRFFAAAAAAAALDAAAAAFSLLLASLAVAVCCGSTM